MKGEPRGRGRESADAADLTARITRGARGDDDALRAFHKAFADAFDLPFDAFVIGEPVSVLSFGYDGNTRRGLTARCRRGDGSEHEVSAADLEVGARSPAGRYLAAYRGWVGIDAPAAAKAAGSRTKRQHKAEAESIDLARPLELVVLSVKQRAARCRLLGSERVITLRATRLWDVVPGEIALVTPLKQWTYARHPYLSGEIESTRLDAAALGLVPLRLADHGMWNPKKHYWGERGEPIPEWAKPIIAAGPRPELEMEQVLPGEDPENPDSDPILESNDLKEAGDYAGAYRVLMDLCQADLRCLDAHAHLGILAFDRPADAIRHYDVGVRIGELSLGHDFEGLLPWGFIDNRPFLRSMHGYGLCLWRLERFSEAERVFERMLWLNPSDNQGARILLADVRAGRRWEDRPERRWSR